MAEPAMRVALLARPGAACDNLQAALRQAGAEVVLVADPTSSDAGTVSASAPQAVLVALEPSVEDALARYDEILLDPATIVIYDEVALAAHREGWDAARWARHLSAKLGRHHDVLPPGAGIETGIDAGEIEQPSQAVVEIEQPSQAAEGIDFGGFTDEMKLALDDIDPEPEAPAMPVAAPETGIEFEAGFGTAFEAEFEAEFETAPDTEAEAVATPGPATGMSGGIEWEPQSLSTATPKAAVVPEPSEPLVVPAPAPAPAASLSSFGNLTLEEISPEPRQPASPPAAIAEPAHVLSAPSLAASPAVAEARGGVVVLAGIGGPDAVRQFLSALPLGFSRAVVVRQRLDGGRHDRLVRQMQRATGLPVELAQAGARLAPGHVYILPDAMTTVSDAGMAFAGTDAPVPVLAGLPVADSAVLMLSGSDPAMVREVLDMGDAGAFVAAQALEECFDSEAPAALAAAGAIAASPAELANHLVARWSTT